MVSEPRVRAEKAPELRVAVTPSVALLKEPSEAFIAVPLPLAPTESTKNSALVMLLPPVAASLTDAVTVGGAVAGSGLTATLEALGPVAS